MIRYKCLIAENELLERDLLEHHLRKIEQAEIVAVCDDGLVARKILQTSPVDIVFTDVNMPGLSGLGLLQSIKNPPAFVLVSAFPENAAEGFDLEVADFIRKPVSTQRLLRAFEKAVEQLNKRNESFSRPAPSDGIFMARTSNGLQKLAIVEIVYAESKGNFSSLHLKDGTEIMILVGLKHLEEQLPQGTFIRLHRNFIVNWTHVSLISKEEVSLCGQLKIPIGDAYKKSLAERLGHYPFLERYPEKKSQ